MAAFFFAQHNPGYLFLAVVAGLLTLPLSAVFVCDKGWPRWAMWAITVTLAACGLTPLALAGIFRPEEGSALAETVKTTVTFFFVVIFLSQWAANWLMTQKPRR